VKTIVAVSDKRRILHSPGFRPRPAENPFTDVLGLFADQDAHTERRSEAKQIRTARITGGDKSEDEEKQEGNKHQRVGNMGERSGEFACASRKRMRVDKLCETSVDPQIRCSSSKYGHEQKTEPPSKSHRRLHPDTRKDNPSIELPALDGGEPIAGSEPSPRKSTMADIHNLRDFTIPLRVLFVLLFGFGRAR
jgi:hypothetical protein